MSISSSLKCTTNPAARSVFSLASLSGSGLEPPLQFAKEKCTCWSIPGIFRNSLICVFTLLQYTLYHLAVRNILWALICPHPGYIWIHHFARLLPIWIRTATINCNRAQKNITLDFSRLWVNVLKNWIYCARQENISGILWGCQSCAEKCVSRAIFVSLQLMVKAGQHDPIQSMARP